MKKFEAPMMDVQRLDSEGIIATSTCEVCNGVGCTACYWGVVDCSKDSGYTCTSRVCTYDDSDDF